MRFSVTHRGKMVEAIRADFAGGKIRFYTGVRPATVEGSLSGNTLLAELTFASPAFPVVTLDGMVAYAITPDTAADATGTASWVRLLQSDGTTVIGDLLVAVGIGDSEAGVTTVDFRAGVTVSMDWLYIIMPQGT